jgi:Xaa-Pro aminopeptidase
MISFTSEEFMRRIGGLQQHLAEQHIDLVVLNLNTDIYYYTGSVQPLYLLVPASGEPVALARKAVERIGEEAPHVRAEGFAGTKDLTATLRRYGLVPAARVGFTLDTAAYATVSRLQGILGGSEIIDVSWDIRTLRMVKSASEIAVQAKAGEIMAELPELLREGFEPGMTELELTALIENHFRLHGHAAFIRCRREGIEMSGFGVCSGGGNSLAGTKFDGICAGVGLSPAAPYGAGDHPIKPTEPVILDFAFNLAGYHVDQTRMFSWGMPSAQVLKAYGAMISIQQSIFAGLTPGRLWEEIYDNAVELAGKLGYGEIFMGIGAERVKFVGHGVGLELDEPPYLAPKMKYPIQEGMMIAVEPKVAIPNVGVVGIEDTVLIRSNRAERITLCTTDFIVVE